MRTELIPQYDARQNFYNKAIIEAIDDKTIQLYSYGTLVAEIKDGVARVYGWYSQTTGRHIREFLKQNGFFADTKEQILKKYYLEK